MLFVPGDVELRKALTTLMVLLGTCQQTLRSLEATGDIFETDLSGDLRLMIERTERELEVLAAKIEARN
jgi:hypothetical protein